jgi:hypothetical protein
MQDTFKEKKADFKNNWNDTTLQSHALRERELLNVISGRKSAAKIYNLNNRGLQKKKTLV